MNITTKFDVNQSVYFIHKDKLTCLKIGSLKVHFGCDEYGKTFQTTPTITYNFRIYLFPDSNPNASGNKMEWLEKYEGEIFATPEELFESMKNKLKS